MSKSSAEIDVSTTVEISLYCLEDVAENDVAYSSFELDSDGDISIQLEGYSVTSEEYALLQKAKSLSQDDWNLIETANLINP